MTSPMYCSGTTTSIFMIGSRRCTPGALGAVLEAERRGDLEGLRARVDLVVAAVGRGGTSMSTSGKPGEDAAGHRLADALLDGRDELLGDDAADDVVLEDEARAALAGLDLHDDVAVLAAAAGLLGVLVLAALPSW